MLSLASMKMQQMACFSKSLAASRSSMIFMLNY